MDIGTQYDVYYELEASGTRMDVCVSNTVTGDNKGVIGKMPFEFKSNTKGVNIIEGAKVPNQYNYELKFDSSNKTFIDKTYELVLSSEYNMVHDKTICIKQNKRFVDVVNRYDTNINNLSSLIELDYPNHVGDNSPYHKTVYLCCSNHPDRPSEYIKLIAKYNNSDSDGVEVYEKIIKPTRGLFNGEILGAAITNMGGSVEKERGSFCLTIITSQNIYNTPLVQGNVNTNLNNLFDQSNTDDTLFITMVPLFEEGEILNQLGTPVVLSHIVKTMPVIKTFIDPMADTTGVVVLEVHPQTHFSKIHKITLSTIRGDNNTTFMLRTLATSSDKIHDITPLGQRGIGIVTRYKYYEMLDLVNASDFSIIADLSTVGSEYDMTSKLMEHSNVPMRFTKFKLVDLCDPRNLTNPTTIESNPVFSHTQVFICGNYMVWRYDNTDLTRGVTPIRYISAPVVVGTTSTEICELSDTHINTTKIAFTNYGIKTVVFSGTSVDDLHVDIKPISTVGESINLGVGTFAKYVNENENLYIGSVNGIQYLNYPEIRKHIERESSSYVTLYNTNVTNEDFSDGCEAVTYRNGECDNLVLCNKKTQTNFIKLDISFAVEPIKAANPKTKARRVRK